MRARTARTEINRTDPSIDAHACALYAVRPELNPVAAANKTSTTQEARGEYPSSIHHPLSSARRMATAAAHAGATLKNVAGKSTVQVWGVQCSGVCVRCRGFGPVCWIRRLLLVVSVVSEAPLADFRLRTHPFKHTRTRTQQLYRDCLRVVDHIASKVSREVGTPFPRLVDRLIDRVGGSSAFPPIRDAAHIPALINAPTHITHPQSPKGIALRNMLRSEFRRNANVTEPKQVEQLKMK